VDDQVNEFSYDANVAGLRYSLSRDTEGLFLAVYGFNDKLHILLARLVHEMRNVRVKPERFDVIKDALLKNIKNSKFHASQDYVLEYMKYVLTTRQWTNNEKEVAIKGELAPYFSCIPLLIM
jgi:insulysin